MSHIPPLDPNVAARKGFRESEERLKRFWKTVDVAEGEGGWAVTLDGRTPKTPAHAPLRLPTEAAARLAAEEWAAQGEFIDPATMPATRLASTAIDRVSQAREPVAARGQPGAERPAPEPAGDEHPDVQPRFQLGRNRAGSELEVERRLPPAPWAGQRRRGRGGRQGRRKPDLPTREVQTASQAIRSKDTQIWLISQSWWMSSPA